jgi:hypothetical protein
MSKLVKAIEDSYASDRVVIESPLFNELVSVKEEYTQEMSLGTIYKIGVRLSSSVVIPDHTPELLPLAVKRTKHQIIEAVFGEFREDFRLIEMALYRREFQKAADALAAFEAKMFSGDE